MFKKSLIVVMSIVFLSGCTHIGYKTSINYDIQNPVVTISLYSKDRIVIELYPEIAPNTVNNFISLIKDGYYDGLKFHRVLDGYLVQSGDPLMNNYGSPGYTIEGEFKKNGFKNNLGHKRGSISMARSEDFDSAGSQFFITLDDANYLDGYYASFGRVLQGLEILDDISQMEKMEILSNELLSIEKVEVELGSYKYNDPKIIPIEE